MNLNKIPNIPKRHRAPDHLASETWHLANALSGGTWDQKEIERVQLTRSIVESIYPTYDVEAKAEENKNSLDDENSAEYSEGEVPTHTQPVGSEVTLSFLAVKRYMEYEEGLVPFYVLQSETTQHIEKEEIPNNVLEEIVEDAGASASALFSMEDDEDDSSDVVSFDKYAIHRTQKVLYEIDQYGEIDDYSISYAYSLDGSTVHETEYTNSESGRTWDPVTIADGSSLEGKPFLLPVLNKAAYKREIKNFNDSFIALLAEKELSEAMEFSALPRQEHIRRILGMLGVLSGGIVDLRKR